jgi:hypothetical protein
VPSFFWWLGKAGERLGKAGKKAARKGGKEAGAAAFGMEAGAKAKAASAKERRSSGCIIKGGPRALLMEKGARAVDSLRPAVLNN